MIRREDDGGRGPILETVNGYVNLVGNSELEVAKIKGRVVVCRRCLVHARGRTLERDGGSGYEIAINVKYGTADAPELRLGSSNVLRHRRQYRR